jgi:hypothetical protein
MKKIIRDTIDLDELNGAVVTTWISKLLDLQKQYGVCATITTFADEIYHDKGSILEMSFNRLETDEEYEYRLEREEYLEQIQKNKPDFSLSIKLHKDSVDNFDATWG